MHDSNCQWFRHDGVTSGRATPPHETTDTFSESKHPENTRFRRAMVSAVSPQLELEAVIVPPVSSRQRVAPNTQAMH